jgi:hypothetical protein
MSHRGLIVSSVLGRRIGFGAVSLLIAAGGLVTLSPAAQASPPDNDDIGNAQVLSGTLPVIVTGSNVDAAREPGEPNHLGIAAGASVWYAWTAPSGEDAVPSVWASTIGSDFDTTVSVYTGSPSSISTLTLIDDDDDYGQAAGPGRAAFNPTAGTTYYIAVDGSAAGDEVPTGDIRLKLTVPSATTGHISGTVTNSSSQPVMNVCVHVVDQDNDAIGPRAITEANGSYSIAAPAVSDNHLLFRACDDLSPNVSGEYYSTGGGSQTLAAASDINVVAGGTTSGINAQLAPGTLLSGTVTGPETDPAADVCVKATRLTDRSPSGDRITKTDEDGHYAVPGLDGGDYRLRFGGTEGLCFGGNPNVGISYYAADGSTNDIGEADVLTAVEGVPLSGIDVGLGAAPGRIKGTVLDSGSSPIANICVRADDGTFFSSVVDTNAAGKYTISNVPPGAAYVVRFVDCHPATPVYLTQYYNGQSTAAAADLVVVASSADTTGIDATLVREATIGGQITDAHGNPRDPACVDVHTAGDPSPLLTGLEADSDGRWSTSVAPGDYNVHLYNCGSGGLSFEQRWYDGEQTQGSATTVTVTDGQSLLTLDQVLPGTPDTDGRITGRVTDDTPAQNPLEGICVTAVRAGIPTETQTDELGRYEFGSLMPADYKVGFAQCDESADYDVLPQYWNDEPDFAAADLVSVEAGTTTSGVVARMHPAGAISGVVTNEDGDPLENICVTANANPEPGAPLAEVYTNALGEYTIIGLTTGDYFVMYEDCSEVYAGQWYHDVPFVSPYEHIPDGDPLVVPVTEGQTSTLDDTELVRNGTISGTVTNEAGEPLADICAITTSRNGDFYQPWPAMTDADGNYTIGGLQTTSGPDDEYVVWFVDCYSHPGPDYGMEYYDNKLDDPTANTVAVVFGEDTPDIDAVLQSDAPVNTGLPTVTGTTSVGATLTAHHGTWDHEPVFDYQWQRCDAVGEGCVPVNDATDRKYVPTAADLDHRFYVTVTARNSVGDASVDSALTDVIDDNPPANDDIQDRTVLGSTLPVDLTDTNVNATRQTGEPAHLGFTKGASVWYEWTAPTGGGAIDALSVSLAGSSYDSTLSVYDGTPTPFSGLDLVAESDESGSGGPEEVVFAPEPGTTYYIAVDGYWDSAIDTIDTGTIEMVLSAGSGISGTVTDDAGLPVREICVSAFDQEENLLDEVYTAGDGTFFLSLPPGDYRINYFDCLGQYEEQWYDGVTDIEDATAVAVGQGEVVAGIDAELVQLIPFGSISGTVTNEAGEPIPDICVSAIDEDTGSYGMGSTDQDGTYVLRGLGDPDNPGDPLSYVVAFIDCSSFYGDELYDNQLDPAQADLVEVELEQRVTGIDAVLQHDAPVNTTAPSITGDTAVGATLTAHRGQWDHEPSMFDYEWERCDADLEDCLPIDEDGTTYVTTSDDAGYRIRVTVSATNSIGSTDAVAPATELIGLPRVIDLPAVTGPIAVGGTMTVSNGTWSGSPTFTYQWMRCDAAAWNCTAISGQQGATYESTSDDAGHKLRVNVTATNTVGSVTKLALSNGTVVGGPSSIDAPAVTGPATMGATLNVSTGTWTGSPTSYAYQWVRCDASGANCTPISGAQSTTYVTAIEDAGHRIRVNVTASNAVGSNTRQATSNGAIIGAPGSLVAPGVSGPATIGATLSVSTGTWTGSPTSYAYQWLRCDSSGSDCTQIGGAHATTYETTNDDFGHKVRVNVSASNAYGTTTRLSTSNGSVTGVPGSLDAPAVNGPAMSGATLNVTTGTWSGSPTSYAYQWTRCGSDGSDCVPIDGADTSTYVATTSDRGHRLRVIVTATNAIGSGTRLSFSNGVIGPTGALGSPEPIDPPAVSGEATIGATLSVSTGTWSDSPTSFAYQWMRCAADGSGCTAISGEQGSTYETTNDDFGYKIRVEVTASNATGSNTRLSLSIGSVSGLPGSLVVPVVTGQARVGATLGVTTGGWSGSPTSFTFQWTRCDAAGADCTTIAGADTETYVATADDVGAKLRVWVSASNAFGHASRLSYSNGVIGASDAGAYGVTGTCGTLGLSGPGFILTADPTKAVPAGTVLTVVASGTASAGTWSTTGGGADIASLSGTARQITLTAPIAAGASKAFRSTLSIATAFTLNAAASLPSGYTSTGGKSTGSVQATLIGCTTT